MFALRAVFAWLATLAVDALPASKAYEAVTAFEIDPLK